MVQIPRMEKSIKSSSFLHRVFTDKEIDYCRSAKNFAGIFAAKEAYFKAQGSGIKMPLTSVEILHDDNGKPYLNGIENSSVSISHDGDYSISVVMLW